MRRYIILILSIFLISSAYADSITFSGGESSVVLRDGRENVVLSNGASVTVGSMTINADRINLSGNNWRSPSLTSFRTQSRTAEASGLWRPGP